MIELTWFMGCDKVICYSFDVVSFIMGLGIGFAIMYFIKRRQGNEGE